MISWDSSLIRKPKVIGFDASAKSLDLARKRLALHNFDPWRFELLQICDITAVLPLPDSSVDYIYCEGVLHHTSRPFEILQEFARVLKPRGQSCIMVYNRNSLWWHLYTAYQRMILENAFPGLSLPEAFTRNIDGLGCPIARAYAPEEFISLCEKAGFKIQFLGGYLSNLELEVLQRLYAPALADTRLPEEHKAFLRALKPDAFAYPLHQGKSAGIGGVYSLSLPFNVQR